MQSPKGNCPFHIDKEKSSRELCDRETRGYVFCTPLLIVAWRFSTEPPQYFWSKRALKFTFCQF
ncbi:hypothetical protein T05_14969 [Trichinella murrelli]|uniref:Uncharacterized protein n=1 Tax=Trichinella murrelli TaxID=144512 RepID=A0A0V0T2Y4_9BILA|nr:hypothetical protein T05_8122 [Trichinella murrelli]KRX50552.1 hypothetical protein T05_14969 [Trichinella murrelli]